MPRPRNPDIDRWEWPGVPGYVRPVRQKDYQKEVAYHRFKSYRKSTGLPFNPEFKQLVRKLHMKWIEEIILREAGFIVDTKDEPSSSAPRSFIRLSESFIENTSHRLPKNSRDKINQAVGAHFKTDVPLTYDAIYEQLTKSLRKTVYSQSTIRKHLIEIARLCRYAVDHGWLSRNPVDLIGIPKQPEKTDVDVWTRDEVEKIVAWLKKYDSRHAEWYALFVEWQSLMSMRPSETLRMRRAHVEKDRLRIPKTKTSKPRSIPLLDPQLLEPEFPKRAAWQRRVQEILAELERLYVDRRDGLMQDWHTAGWQENHLWPFNNTDKLREAFTEARNKLKLRQGRVYDLRATAEDYWVWELDFDLETICELAGHSPAIYIKHYRRRYGTHEHAKMLMR